LEDNVETKKRAVDLQEIFIQDCKFRNLPQATIRDYNRFLTDLKKRLGDCQETNKQQIKELVLEKLNSGQSAASANHYIRAAKVFYSFLQREGYMANNPLAGLSLVTMPEKLKQVLEPNQVSKLISTIPEKTFFNIRDRAMITVLFDTAIRLKELLNIKYADLDLKNCAIKVLGKGRKDRVVPIGHKTRRELIRYLTLRGENHSEYLFCTLTGNTVTPRNFVRTLSDYGKGVGIKVSPHLLRHSAATFLAKSEMPAQHIQILLGHSSLAVTQNYINRIVAQEGLQVSHRRLSPGDRL
jgi:integrase/recombinase XerD